MAWTIEAARVALTVPSPISGRTPDPLVVAEASLARAEELEARASKPGRVFEGHRELWLALALEATYDAEVWASLVAEA